MATETTVKVIEELDDRPTASEIAEILERLSSRCFSAFGQDGKLSTIQLDRHNDSKCVFIAIARVEE